MATTPEPTPDRFLEAAAASSETLAALDLIEDSVVVLDRQGRFLFVNTPTLATINKSREEILGMPYQQVLGDMVSGEVADAITNTLVTNQKITHEFFYQPTQHWYELHVLPADRTITIHGVDITEKKRAQEITNRLTRALDTISNPIVMLDQDWRYTFVNTAAAEHMERPREKLIGRVIWDIFPELAGSSFGEAYLSAMVSAAPITVDDYYAPRDQHFRASYFPTADGLTVHFVDNTELKRSRERLLQLTNSNANESEIIHAFRLMPTPVILVGPDMRYLFYNDAALEPRNLKLEDVIGKYPWEVNPLLNRDWVTGHVIRALRDGHSHYELQLPPTNRWFSFELVGWNGKVIVAAVETTKLKNSERSIGILTESLLQAMDQGPARKDARSQPQTRPAYGHRTAKQTLGDEPSSQ
jgi:PAS domain S-box-containing protein